MAARPALQGPEARRPPGFFVGITLTATCATIFCVTALLSCGRVRVRHVTEEEIWLFISGQLEGAGRLRVLRHLLSACAVCLGRSAAYRALLEGEPAPDLPESETAVYEIALDRALDGASRYAARLEDDRRWSERLLRKIREQKITGYRGIMDAIDWEMPQRAKVEALLALSFGARYRDAEEMRSLAEMAVFAASCLANAQPGERLPEAEIADLNARAFTELANARRRNEDFHGAEEALTNAEACRLCGSGDPLLEARRLDVLASLRTDQRHLDEAIAYLDRVHEIYLEHGETHLAGRALISKGINIAYDDRPREASTWFRKGISLLDAERDPELRRTAEYSLLHAFVSCGEYRDGRRLLLESGLRQAFVEEPLKLLKLRWLEGIIFAGLGKLARAEHLFSEVESGFFGAGLEYEAVLASLERAGVLLKQGRLAEVDAVVAEALETFEALHVNSEAVRALVYLQELCAQKSATADFVRRVIDFLQKVQSRPYLRFAPV
jgi:tetratricopeptide (TPR) repeat protein